MLNSFLLSVVIAAQLFGTTLSQALRQPVFIVPTLEKDSFEWRAQKPQASAIAAPTRRDDDRGPDITADAAIVLDQDSGRILWQKNPDAVLSIASLSKLMTAIAYLAHPPVNGFDTVYTIRDDDHADGKALHLGTGEKLTTFQFFYSMLVGSDNDAAQALAHATGLSDDAFVVLMNQKAKALNMYNTHFVEPTGLSVQNQSTVTDLAHLAQTAFALPEIRNAAARREHRQETVDTHRLQRIITTNRLLFDEELDIIAGKTGFSDDAGYCVIELAREPKSGREVLVVVLHADTEIARFDDAKKILLWAFAHYEFHHL